LLNRKTMVAETKSQLFSGAPGALKDIIDNFEQRAARLSEAYHAMQKDFGNLNLELEKKNRRLTQALEKQEQTQAFLSSILHSMNNALIAVDTRGIITHFNKAAEQISGFNAQDVQGKSYSDCFGADQKIFQVISSRVELDRYEKTLTNKSGQPVPVSSRISLLQNPDGNVVGALEVLSDLSRIKDLEAAMLQSKTMAALGEMSATVAHEIRNPLGAMGMWAELLDRDIETRDPRKRTIQKIIEGLSHLNKIVSNLLLYTRPIRTKMRSVNVAELVGEVADFIEIEIQRLDLNIDVEKHFALSDDICIQGDPEKLQQVFINICLNAIHEMQHMQQATLTLGTSETNNGFGCISIRDHGKGIDPSHLEKIFDPFHTTKENGTGLGLAISKRFVLWHQGYIDARNCDDGGAVFSVYIPLHNSDKSS